MLRSVETVFIRTILQIFSSFFRPFLFSSFPLFVLSSFRLFVFSGSESFDPLGSLRKIIFDPPVSMNAIGASVLLHYITSHHMIV